MSKGNKKARGKAQPAQPETVATVSVAFKQVAENQVQPAVDLQGHVTVGMLNVAIRVLKESVDNVVLSQPASAPISKSVSSPERSNPADPEPADPMELL